MDGWFAEITAVDGDGLRHIAFAPWDAEYELTLCGEHVYFSDYSFSDAGGLCEACQHKLISTFIDAAISAD